MQLAAHAPSISRYGAHVYAAVQTLGEAFDIVYTGIGALCWLPDIVSWARVVAACTKPGGVFYLYEGHPMLWALDAERDDGKLRGRSSARGR